MIDRLNNLNLEGLSFWIGFAAATVFWFLITRLAPYVKQAFISMKESAQAARQNLQTGAEQRLRASTLKHVQSLHLASPLFALDEILITPHLMAPPVLLVPNQEPPLDYVTENLIAYMPDFPELAAAYNGHTIPVLEALKGEANLVITGHPGSGKTTALAYLATLLARRDDALDDLKYHVPLFLHANELVLPLDEETNLLTPIIDALMARSSKLGQSRLPEAINTAFNEERAMLLIDGLDEVAQESAENISDYLYFILEDYPQTRIVTAASPYFVDGLLSLGLIPIPMAAWSQRQQAEFIQQWSNLWQQFVQPSTTDEEDKNGRAIDPIFLNGWLLGNNAVLTPLEFTLKVWSAYAGDSRGPKGTDAIEAYLRRMSVGIPKVRSALEHLAVQMVLTMRSSFTQAEAQAWTSGFDSDTVEGAGLSMTSETEEKPQTREITIPRVLSDLTRNGLLIAQSSNHLTFVHPTIASYLAGSSLAFSGQSNAILTQENWPIKYNTIHYLATQSDLSSEIVNLFTDTEDPLNSGALIAGRWLRDIPIDAVWRKTILQHLTNMLQQEPLPMGFRTRVLACLAAANDPGIGTMFRHLLKSPTNSVCHLAALGCGFLRDSQAVTELSRMASDATKLGQAACLALVNIGTKPAIEEAAAIFLHGEEALRRVISEGFAFNTFDGHPILKEASTMEDLLVRRTSIHGLRLINQSWAVEILDNMQIEDAQWVVKNAAGQAMEEINDIDPYIPRPLNPLENTTWLIEFAGERGMGVSGDQANEMLLRALREGSPDQTLAALDYYRLTGNDSIFPAIYHLLYGSDTDIIEAAYETLWQLKGTGAQIPSPIQFGLGY
jgi:hypothetical protein